jgi:WD40 repeat protein
LLNPVTILLSVVLLNLSPFTAMVGDAQIPTLNKKHVTWTASWSHDDKFVAVGNSNGELAVYETTNWKKIKRWKNNFTTISRVEWNPKFPILAVASTSYKQNNSVVQLYNISTDKTLLTRNIDLQGRAVTWSPDGQQVAFVGKDGKISIHNKNGEQVKTLSYRNPGALFDIDWHPTKNILLAVEENIYFIDIDRDSLLATYDDGSVNKGILSCQWHTSGKFFVTGDYGHENEGEPSYLKYWNDNGSLLKRTKKSKAEYRNLRWSKNGKYLAAATDVLLVLNEKGDVVRKTKFDTNNLWGVDWSNKGDRMIITDGAGNIRICDAKGKLIKTFRQ